MVITTVMIIQAQITQAQVAQAQITVVALVVKSEVEILILALVELEMKIHSRP